MEWGHIEKLKSVQWKRKMYPPHSHQHFLCNTAMDSSNKKEAEMVDYIYCDSYCTYVYRYKKDSTLIFLKKTWVWDVGSFQMMTYLRDQKQENFTNLVLVNLKTHNSVSAKKKTHKSTIQQTQHPECHKLNLDKS